MKLFLSKQNIPLFFLICTSLFWFYYYSSNHWLNGYGTEKFEWMLMLDVFISTPLVCFYFLGKNRKQALVKSLAYMGLLILLGSFIIPIEEKHLWKYLESTRYIVIVLVVIFELFIISTVVLAIQSAFKQNKDPDLAISEPIEKIMGNGTLSKLMQFDIRLWSFVLFPGKIHSNNYQGQKHFYGDLKDGTHSFLQGFVFIIIFEIPLVHVLLHFIWSPLAANIITGLTVFSLAFFMAEYRALAKRPISLVKEHLIIRYGLSHPHTIKISEITEIRLNKKAIFRNPKVKRYNLFGIPNIEIMLNNKEVERIYLGINNPQQFIKVIEQEIETIQSNTNKQLSLNPEQ